MGFNIVTRGHKRAPKCQNIAVGPEDPPPPGELLGFKTLGEKGLRRDKDVMRRKKILINNIQGYYCAASISIF